MNDGIILLKKLDDETRGFKQSSRQSWMSKIAQVSSTRLKAVLLTTTTTALGLFPTAYGIAGFDAVLAEMMLALSWGLILGTVVVLILLPVLYSMLWGGGSLKLPNIGSYMGLGLPVITLFLLSILVHQPLFASDSPSASPHSSKLTLTEFIQKVAANHPNFQKILLERLYLQHRGAANTPPSDLILSTNAQYGLFLGSDNLLKGDFDGSLSLTQVFASTGTHLSAVYSKIGNLSRNVARYQSTLGFEIGLSVIQNAFGRTTRLLKKNTRVENEFMRYQILEAYEDYFAALMKKYVLWYEAWSQLKVNQKRFKEYSAFYKLLKSRRRMRVALPEDVKKGQVELLEVKEALLEAETAYQNIYQEIIMLGGWEKLSHFKPVVTDTAVDVTHFLEEDIAAFIGKTRTLKILRLVEKQANLKNQIAMDDLLPKAEAFLGYNMLGEGAALSNPEHKFYSGLRGELNFTNGRQKAFSETARLDIAKNKLSKQAALLNFRIALKSMYRLLLKESKLQKLSREKLKLARGILAAERSKYLRGRLTFNDLLRAQETSDRISRTAIMQNVRFQLLIIEWKRLSDRLVDKVKSVKKREK